MRKVLGHGHISYACLNLFYPKSLTLTEICDDNTLFYKCLLKPEYWPLIDLVVDYLYRVLASNDAGTGQSPWVYGKTKEGGTHLLWTKNWKTSMHCLLIGQFQRNLKWTH